MVNKGGRPRTLKLFNCDYIRDYQTKEILITKPPRYAQLTGPWEKRCPSCDTWVKISKLVQRYWDGTPPKLCQSCQMKISIPKGRKMTDGWYATRIERGIIVDPSLKSDWLKYRQAVWAITNRTLRTHTFENQEKRGRAGTPNAYHVDHKYSIRQGFDDNVPPEVIGSAKNLEFIPWRENKDKGVECSITLEELLKG